MASLKMQATMEALIGGENRRADLGARFATLGGPLGLVVPCILTDAGTAATQQATLWDSSTSPLTLPIGGVFLVDPDDEYTDGLLRTAFSSGYAPRLTLEITIASDTTGTAAAVALAIDVFRETPFFFPTFHCRPTISTANGATGLTTKYLNKIKARNNMESGFGSIAGELFLFQ